ncbi:uncharacterized protein F5891DRAFT_988130 [Suillus fuscotomentosus]|uniref:Uncharacterized protein n=1 Tax=Suillus fuscotomentosus TaxID=1912939 RepID=A0AAD4DP64_9AGAM|nr:uncharacterized protein F5891DRAFT_988130 [Suillus fuscotomentosus]KAG1887527.1 hypothetical protein F5891DRAFT_988130 [Suillus fuscotomentosus]
MTIPSEQANHALNITLAALQSLMKRCIKVKEGDPEALRLSDEIARRVAKDLKMYGGNATSFSPQLLSFAAVVRENSKGGAFESVPDWTSVTDDDPRIKSHPRFDKTVDYLPPSSLDDLVIAATSTANPPTIPTTATAAIPPSTLASPSKPSLTESDILAGPEPEEKGSSDLGKEKAEDPPIPINTPATPPTKYNLFVAGTKKRKAAEEDTDAVVAVAKTKLPSPSEEPVKKRKITSKTISKTELGSDEDIATPWKVASEGSNSILLPAPTPQASKSQAVSKAPVKRASPRIDFLSSGTMLIKEMEIYALGSLVDSGWMHLDGWRYRACKRGNARARIHREVRECVKLPYHAMRGMILYTVKRASRLQRRIVQQKASLEEEIKLAPTNLVEPEPTAREILQGIQDLGRRLDLLAATERVDALEVRVDSMETNLLKRLDGLEQRLNESDARWKSLS